MIHIYQCVQYSPEWWEIRNGRPTASEFDKILTPKKWRPSNAQNTLIAELAAAIADPSPNFFADHPMSRAMANGRDMEPRARAWYEVEIGPPVQQVGFVIDGNGRFGCSPDGLIESAPGEDGPGGLELKCPMLKTQAAYLQAGRDVLPPEYACQVHGSMIVTGRRWWDFMSYAPGLPVVYRRVRWDEKTDALAAELGRFWVKFNDQLRTILGREVDWTPPPTTRAAQSAVEGEVTEEYPY